MPTQPEIITQLLDILTNKLTVADLTATSQDLLDRLAIQLEYWDSMAISVSSNHERYQQPHAYGPRAD